MTLIGVALTIIVIGVLLWLVQQYVPMDATLKKILIAVVVICVVLWLLQVFGIWGYLGVPVPRVGSR